MTITDSQIINLIGRFTLSAIKLQNHILVIGDPNASASDKTTAKQNIKNTLIEIYALFNTFAAKTNFTPPTTTYTDQQLADLGIT